MDQSCGKRFHVMTSSCSKNQFWESPSLGCQAPYVIDYYLGFHLIWSGLASYPSVNTHTKSWRFSGRINSSRPRPNRLHFADDIFKCIFLNENIWIPIKISLKFVPKGHINNIPALVQIMAWRRPGDKPLSGPMMIRLPTHICVTRHQWVNRSLPGPRSTELKVALK